MITSDLMGKAFLQFLQQQEETLEKGLAVEIKVLTLIQIKINDDEKALDEVRDLIGAVTQSG
jgi:hypothetical protein